ncbi:hypothetical protein PPACK8108_LOCUS14044 [Phakopsora pachyrhizi]|uniref:ER membrane protein complex subunit 4 n=1 Tax=Phakopsora pachyrhizi TaxID=170000 RepID=A0AAV0B7J8_PHAPC|nr:hypothetical protein PPACK8108_LOCUS14044 [Phakopsora pachyrhizi]
MTAEKDPISNKLKSSMNYSHIDAECKHYKIDLINNRPKFDVVDPPIFKPFKSDQKLLTKNADDDDDDDEGDMNLAIKNKELLSLRQKKSWEVALAPAKQVPMQAFMIWMSGNGVQIFSVMMVYMLIKGSITGSISVNQTFKPFQSSSSSLIKMNNSRSLNAKNKRSTKNSKKSTITQEPNKDNDSLILQKLTFVACQGLLLALGIWKVNGMGLLPTRISDWLMYQIRPVDAIRNSLDFGNNFSGIIRNPQNHL